MLLGDQVKDQDFQNAEFEQLGSSPPTFESARAVDALSLIEGYEQTTADATSAYTQTFMGGARGVGTPTWVRILRHRWPSCWEGEYRDPVVRMVLALYGHVDAGGYWEEYCTKNVLKYGFEKVEGWDSTFWHPERQALLVVYVDDFKLASPTNCTKAIWKKIRKDFELSEPEAPDRFLGCCLR